ncbi:hypothetical protein LPJ81_000413 [Coemansia sp. IMI 209127]|nr:hypothetical protein LPJ81_000413 [Coemansia sp. IMI 209127]
MFGRISYLYRVTFESKDAVLKFTYMPVTQLPEGAVYQLLKESCKGLIPEVYASGVIAHEWSGYRPVFLITEYCGVAVDRFAQAQRSNYQTLDHVEGLICNAIKRSSNCIAKAYSVGVLHRNIAPKNILIKDECVKIVGWGSSRLRTDTEVNGIAALGRTWRFNTEAVLAEELQYDTVIYASSFTSIQVFLGTSSRDLMHDLESLFYVALHSLATFNGNVGDNKPSPYRPSLHEGRLTAAARIGCLSNEASYLQNFGVAGCHLAMAKVFDAMYRFLFFSSGVFIAGSFLTDPNRKRVRDVGVASGFMDSRLLLSPKEAGDLLVPLGQEITRAGGEASLVRADKRRNSDGDQNNPVAKRPRHME